MNSEQVAMVLAKVQLGDNRRTDDEGLVLAEWEDTIGDLPYEDCIEAVRRHRRASTEYLQPAHVRAQVRMIQREQERAERVQLAIQGRPVGVVAPFDRARFERETQEALVAERIRKGRDPETGAPVAK